MRHDNVKKRKINKPVRSKRMEIESPNSVYIF